MTMNDDELIAHAIIGDEAKKFKESEAGKTLLGMALQEVQEAQEALEKVDPTDEKSIRKLQNKAWCGRNFEQWLDELITKGDQALEVYKHEQKD